MSHPTASGARFGAFSGPGRCSAFLWTGMWRAAPDTRPESCPATYLGFFVLHRVRCGCLGASGGPAAGRLRSCSASGRQVPRLVVVNNWFGLFSAYIGFFPAALRYLTPLPDGQRDHLAGGLYDVIGLYYRVTRISALEGETLIAIFITDDGDDRTDHLRDRLHGTERFHKADRFLMAAQRRPAIAVQGWLGSSMPECRSGRFVFRRRTARRDRDSRSSACRQG
jgi:hypothetical protein